MSEPKEILSIVADITLIICILLGVTAIANSIAQCNIEKSKIENDIEIIKYETCTENNDCWRVYLKDCLTHKELKECNILAPFEQKINNDKNIEILKLYVDCVKSTEGHQSILNSCNNIL